MGSTAIAIIHVSKLELERINIVRRYVISYYLPWGVSFGFIEKPSKR
jgi:hypothetical protein